MLLAHWHEAAGLLVRLAAFKLHESAALDPLGWCNLGPRLVPGVFMLVLMEHVLFDLLLLDLADRSLLLMLVLRVLLLEVHGFLLVMIGALG